MGVNEFVGHKGVGSTGRTPKIYHPTAAPSVLGSLPPVNTPVSESLSIIWPLPNVPPCGDNTDNQCPRLKSSSASPGGAIVSR